jgi:uncharacterized membrane protein
MDVADLVVSPAWLLAGWLVALPLLAWSAWRGDWSRFRESEPVHAFLGALASMVALWSLRGSVGDGLGFHLLGSAILALAAGPLRACAGGAVVVGILTLLRGSPPQNAAWVWLTLVVLPVGTVELVRRLTVAFLPPNFFVYVFVVAFAGGALAFGVSGLAGAGHLAIAGGVPYGQVAADYAPVIIALSFAEATLTGMLVTLAVVYRPSWIATFDDERYLRGR